MEVALSVALGDLEVDGDVEANTRAAADVFRQAGAVVEEVDLDGTGVRSSNRSDFLRRVTLAGCIHLDAPMERKRTTLRS